MNIEQYMKKYGLDKDNEDIASRYKGETLKKYSKDSSDSEYNALNRFSYINRPKGAISLYKGDIPDYKTTYKDIPVIRDIANIGGSALDSIAMAGTNAVNKAHNLLLRPTQNIPEVNSGSGILDIGKTALEKTGISKLYGQLDQNIRGGIANTIGSNMTEKEKQDFINSKNSDKNANDTIKELNNHMAGLSYADENSSFGTKLVNSLEQSAGNMIGSAVVGKGNILPGMGLTTYTQAEADARQKGLSEDDVKKYALKNAGIEVGSELVVPGSKTITEFLKNGLKAGIKEAGKEVSENGLKGLAKQVVKEGLQEGGTELAQIGTDYGYKDANGNEVFAPNTYNEGKERFLLALSSGALMGGLTDGPAHLLKSLSGKVQAEDGTTKVIDKNGNMIDEDLVNEITRQFGGENISADDIIAHNNAREEMATFKTEVKPTSINDNVSSLYNEHGLQATKNALYDAYDNKSISEDDFNSALEHLNKVNTETLNNQEYSKKVENMPVNDMVKEFAKTHSYNDVKSAMDGLLDNGDMTEEQYYDTLDSLHKTNALKEQVKGQIRDIAEYSKKNNQEITDKAPNVPQYQKDTKAQIDTAVEEVPAKINKKILSPKTVKNNGNNVQSVNIKNEVKTDDVMPLQEQRQKKSEPVQEVKGKSDKSTAKERFEKITKSEEFNKSFPNFRGEVIEPKTDSQKAVKELVGKLNREVVFYKSNEDAPKGFYSDGKAVYVRVNDTPTDIIMKTTGHELFHSIKEDKELFNDLIDYGVNNFTKAEKTRFLKDFKDNPELVDYYLKNEKVLAEEMLAEQMGNNFVDKTFWEELHNKDYSLYERLRDVVLKIFEKIKNTVSDNFLNKKHAEELFKRFQDVISSISKTESDIVKGKIEETERIAHINDSIEANTEEKRTIDDVVFNGNEAEINDLKLYKDNLVNPTFIINEKVQKEVDRIAKEKGVKSFDEVKNDYDESNTRSKQIRDIKSQLKQERYDATFPKQKASERIKSIVESYDKRLGGTYKDSKGNKHTVAIEPINRRGLEEFVVIKVDGKEQSIIPLIDIEKGYRIVNPDFYTKISSRKLNDTKTPEENPVNFSARKSEQQEKIKITHKIIEKMLENTTSKYLSRGLEKIQNHKLTKDYDMHSIIRENIEDVLNDNIDQKELKAKLISSGIPQSDAHQIAKYIIITGKNALAIVERRVDIEKTKTYITTGKVVNTKDFKDNLEEMAKNLVDKFIPFKRVSQDMHDTAIRTATSNNTIEYILDVKLINKKGIVVNEEGLKPLWRRVTKDIEDETDFMMYMLHKDNIARASRGVSTLTKENGEQFNKDESSAVVRQYELEHPDWVEKAGEITGWIRAFEKAWGVETGIMSETLFNELGKLQPNYIPSNKQQTDLEELTGYKNVVGNSFADKSTPINRAKGSDTNAIDPLENIITLVHKFVKTANNNAVGQKLIEAVLNDPAKFKDTVKILVKADDVSVMGKDLIDKVSKDQDIYKDTIEIVKDIPNTAFHTMVNGENVYYEVNDYNLKEALLNVAKPDGQTEAIARKVSNVMKGLITTNNPLFAISNVSRDIPTYLINTTEKNKWKAIKNLFKAMYQIIKKKDMYRLYRAMGVSGAGIMNPKKPTNNASEIRGKKAIVEKGTNRVLEYQDFGVVKKSLDALMKGIKFLPEFTETVPRLAEFINTIERGESVERAVINAMEVTTNFSKSGSLTKSVDAFVPYLNAGVQGLYKTGQVINPKRAIKDPKAFASMLVGAGLSVTLPAIALIAINAGDPDYEKQSQWDKDNFYLIKIVGTHKFFKIPKSREYGFLLGTLFERVYQKFFMDKENAFEDLAPAFKNSFLPPNGLESNLLTPISQSWNAQGKKYNGSFIVPQKLQNNSVEDMWDENTSEIGKLIGKISSKAGISPYHIDYLISSYTGILGQIVLPLATPSKKNKLEFVNKKFVADGDNSLNDFYNNKTTVEQQSKHYDKYNTTGYEVKENEKLKEAYSSAYTEIAKLNKKRDKALASGDTSGAETIQDQINDIAKKTNSKFLVPKK